MLNPEPQPNQIEKVREIAHLSNLSDADFYLKRLEQSQWDATIEDIAEWAKVKNKHTIIKGGGIEIDKSRNRLDITNRIRLRFGLPDLDENGIVVCLYGTDDDFTGSVEVLGAW